jgi:hypothetical protein
VDWFAISYFQVATEGYYRGPNRDAVLALARQKGKPVLIAEASPTRYTVRQKTLTGAAWWDYWFAPLEKLLAEHPEIKALSIIHVDWDSQAQHRYLDWGDSRLDQDPEILTRWRAFARQPLWLPPGPDLYATVRAWSVR